jgi:hypothetical protein
VPPPEKDAARCSLCLGTRRKCSWGNHYRTWRVAHHLYDGDVLMAELEIQRAREARSLVEGEKGGRASFVKPKGGNASPSKRKRGGKESEGDNDDSSIAVKGKGKGKGGEGARPLKQMRSERKIARSEDRGEGPSGVSHAPVIILPAARVSSSAVAALEARVKELEGALGVARGKDVALGAVVTELKRRLQGKEDENAQMRVAVENGDRRLQDLQRQLVGADVTVVQRQLEVRDAEFEHLETAYAQATGDAARLRERISGEYSFFFFSGPFLSSLSGFDQEQAHFEGKLYRESNEMYWSAVEVVNAMEGEEGVPEEAIRKAVELRDQLNDFVVARRRRHQRLD